MKNLYLIIVAILLYCSAGYSQNNEYLEVEKVRLEKARKVEDDIEKFISLNLNNYRLPVDKEVLIKEVLINESHEHGETLNETEIQDALTDAKKGQLRRLYFKNNPEKEAIMKATPRPITQKDGGVALTVPADCVNGDFEQGLAGYSFSLNDLGQFQILNCVISTDPDTDLNPGFQDFIPSTDNFNTEGGTLVTQQGIDASLLPFGPFPAGVNVNMIHGGNASMKLNRSTGGTHVTAMKKTVHPSTNDIGFHFSLIVQNPHSANPELQPFFTVRVYRGDEIVSTNNICITADTNNTIFTGVNNNSLLYTGWVCDRMKIPDELVNTDLTMEFIITDCGLTAHFGTVYVDDICDVCERPAFGSIEMDDTGFNCPTAPFQVCGVITMPNENNGNPNGMVLNVEDSNGNIVQTYTNAVITNPTNSLFERRFCFTVDPSVFSAGNYTFVAIADFGTHTVSDFGATGSVDLSFNSNGTVLDSYVVRNELYWTDSEDSYDLEFVVDSVCCPDNEVIDPIPAYYATTVTENHINIYDVTSHIQFECFRWRVRTSCGWSEWCCITTSQGNDFPPQAYWGNVYEPGCYDGTIDLCDPFLEEGDPVAANGSQFEQREHYIKAFNTINNNARVTYQAGNYVELAPGFSAAKTSVFTARIEECIPQTVFTTVANTSRTGEPNIVSVTQSEQPDNGFKVYPNPTDEIVYVASQTQVKVYIVTDITGKEVMRVNAEKDQTSVNLSNLESGIYMLMAEGKLIQKIIKK
ncbi:T9SS type A sorting domain-containing protein [Flavobacterium suzhouense]|uniref:T9SS type A sorting domain-containing protein n=1 Tax=Flavobacterium suzhouense TaxID=1529638 RepID=A0ABW5NW71_9FLAO